MGDEMVKKVLVGLGTAAIVVVLGLFVVGTVFAQTPTATPQATAPRHDGPLGAIGRGADIVSDAVAKLFGMTREQILTERSAGKTLSQIAKEKGLTDQQVIDALVAEQKAAIDQQLKDGKITQSQADWLLARAKAMTPFELSNPFTPHSDAAGDKANGMHGMRGGRGGWDKQAPQATPTPSS